MGSPPSRSADPPIRRSADPPIRRSTDPPIHRSTDPPIHRSTEPPIRRVTQPSSQRAKLPPHRRAEVLQSQSIRIVALPYCRANMLTSRLVTSFARCGVEYGTRGEKMTGWWKR